MLGMPKSFRWYWPPLSLLTVTLCTGCYQGSYHQDYRACIARGTPEACRREAIAGEQNRAYNRCVSVNGLFRVRSTSSRNHCLSSAMDQAREIDARESEALAPESPALEREGGARGPTLPSREGFICRLGQARVPLTAYDIQSAERRCQTRLGPGCRCDPVLE